MASDTESAAKYVYGIVRTGSGPKPDGEGIGGCPLGVVASHGLGAITSDVPDGPLEAGRDELLAHSRVLASALEQGTVLPMRFGVVMPDEKAVRRELLDAYGHDLEAQLDEMADKVEVNVKGMYDEAAILREIVAEDPEIAALRNTVAADETDASYFDRVRLGELIAAALDEKRGADEQAILDRLAPLAVAIEVGQPIHERMAVNAAFLVARDRIDAFDRALEELAAETNPRIGFRLTGPLPPHSFVELAVEA